MRLFKLALTIALAMFIINGATAQAATYYSRTDGAWRTPATWSYDSCDGGAVGDSTYPDSGDDVIVCDDTVTLSGTETCDSLTIQQNGEVDTGANSLTISDSAGLDIDSGGLLDVSGSGGVTLTGGGVHPIDGTIELDVANSDLTISTVNATLSGDGEVDGQNNGALISITAGETFTNALDTIGITGALQITGAAFFLNQGIVEANDSTTNRDTLLVAVSGASSTAPLDDNSSGQWKASNGGHLEFSNALDDQDARLQLQGDFFISGSGSEIQFDEQPNYSGAASYPFFLTTGHLEMSDGTLDVDEDVSMGSINEYALITGGQIVVAQGMTFEHQ